jgi:hypothetical protein
MAYPTCSLYSQCSLLHTGQPLLLDFLPLLLFVLPLCTLFANKLCFQHLLLVEPRPPLHHESCPSHYSGRGRGRPANPPPPEYLLTQHCCKETSPPLLHITTHNNTQQHYTTALGYIKLPMYQLFLWCLYIMVLRGATSLLRALEGVGTENRDFFGP